MKFVKVTGTAALEMALCDALEAAHSQKVLWLIPGGSNIPIAVKVMKNLSESFRDNLTIALTDERYGDPGHADSNFKQLYERGFSAPIGKFTDILRGKNLKTTLQDAEKHYRQLFADNSVVIGFFGIGADGHIAGMLPGSLAAEESNNFITGYDAGSYIRITLTSIAFRKVNIAIVGAFGKEKLSALQQLRDENLTVKEQPSQILKAIPNVTIFNDQINDKV
jgi:6-phosphogluconolactonase/glucosamine-6-phosphate isomerase/deaminase